MKNIALLIGTTVMLLQLTCSQASPGRTPALADSAALTRAALDANRHLFNFPALVQQVYGSNHYRLLWSDSRNEPRLNEALVLLDCTSQFGLSRKDFQPQALTYDALKQLKPGEAFSKQAAVDIFLTDAIVTMIAQLHYGKMNPWVPYRDIDKLKADFDIPLTLMAALERGDLSGMIRDVQPRLREYRELQEYLRLSIGQYAGDCYEISDETVKTIALNLERLKWVDTNSPTYIAINVPAFTLTYHEAGLSETFRVIVGKPEKPTPLLKTAVTELVTIPDIEIPAAKFRNEILPRAQYDISYLDRNQISIYRKKGGKMIITTPETLAGIIRHPSRYVARQSAGCDNSMGQLVFNLESPAGIYLHDTPETKLFSRADRALSNGCIRLENPEQLARYLLSAQPGSGQDYRRLAEAMHKNTRLTYPISNRIPVLIIYNTSVLNRGELTIYPDIYRMDPAVSKILAPQP